MCGLVHRFATKHRIGELSHNLNEMILIIEIKKYIIILTIYYHIEIKNMCHLQV
jgi:hypothetical protein